MACTCSTTHKVVYKQFLNSTEFFTYFFIFIILHLLLPLLVSLVHQRDNVSLLSFCPGIFKLTVIEFLQCGITKRELQCVHVQILK